MNIVTVLNDCNDCLTRRSVEVEEPFSDEDIQLARDLYRYVVEHADQAVGLAAPQVGINKRIFAIHLNDKSYRKYDFALINPKIVKCSKKSYYVFGGEACLSEPDLKRGIAVKRCQAIMLSGYDVLQNKQITVRLENLPAAVAQHEYDHLLGILLHDYLRK